MRKIRQKQVKTTNQNNKNQKASNRVAPKKFKQQVIYLRKGKPTKGKADAKKVNKQTRKQRNQCNKN
jgi:hypothetical protein